MEAILVDQSYDPSFGHEILDLAREEFPEVRRVALCAGTSTNEVVRTLADVEVNDVLDIPWTPSALEASLGRKSRPDCARTAPPSVP